MFASNKFPNSVLQLTGILKELGYTEDMVYKFWSEHAIY